MLIISLINAVKFMAEVVADAKRMRAEMHAKHGYIGD